MRNLLVIVMVLVSITLVTVVLMQPDKSQTVAKTEAILDQEKDGIEKFTEYTAILFLVLAVIYSIFR
ncbi:preprotein translocase subunit SecG [Oceanivirga miroungae]|uniref:Protein-export membrane protein SecG n=1 Tax=Oceanivirga miroungae TaxID=1130046 RepID=A0A6I8MEX3_9FUSO|nr:preprotein translocase subunit SecG [Oceanivirga miroungae]VWL85655.1 preprotein translocase subunit SecG [Oceanivirga miroungae]